MKDEAIASDNSMTEAEDAYLEAMEEVKTIAGKLKGAEKAFEMVRGKIEALVNKYEKLLHRIDECDDECESDNEEEDDDDNDDSIFDRKAKDMLRKRAQRAEIEAKKAKLEAEQSKQEVERIKSQKEYELTILQVCDVQILIFMSVRLQQKIEYSQILSLMFAPL